MHSPTFAHHSAPGGNRYPGKLTAVALVSHEIRSSVHAITGMAELMRTAFEKGDTEKLKRRLDMLLTSAASLGALVSDILDLDRLEAGKMNVRSERFDLAGLLNEVADAARALVGGKPVTVEIVATEWPAMVDSDPVKVRQIAMNLMSNAAKFTDRGRIALVLSTDRDRMRITVTDTGIGIREEDRKGLFTPYAQADGGQGKRGPGSGLGLAITKKLVDLLGGAITLSSKFGEGTIVEVDLPVTTPARAADRELTAA